MLEMLYIGSSKLIMDKKDRASNTILVLLIHYSASCNGIYEFIISRSDEINPHTKIDRSTLN